MDHARCQYESISTKRTNSNHYFQTMRDKKEYDKIADQIGKCKQEAELKYRTSQENLRRHLHELHAQKAMLRYSHPDTRVGHQEAVHSTDSTTSRDGHYNTAGQQSSPSRTKQGHAQLTFKESASLDPIKKKHSVNSRLFDYQKKQARSLRSLKGDSHDLTRDGSSNSLTVHHDAHSRRSSLPSHADFSEDEIMRMRRDSLPRLPSFASDRRDSFGKPIPNQMLLPRGSRHHSKLSDAPLRVSAITDEERAGRSRGLAARGPGFHHTTLTPDALDKFHTILTDRHGTECNRVIPHIHGPCCSVDRKHQQRLLALELVLKQMPETENMTEDERHNLAELLCCRYLRLSAKNVDTLNAMCAEAGLERDVDPYIQDQKDASQAANVLVRRALKDDI